MGGAARSLFPWGATWFCEPNVTEGGGLPE